MNSYSKGINAKGHAGRCVWLVAVALVFSISTSAVSAQQRPPSKPPATGAGTSMDVLSAEQWREVDKATDRALAWLATQQNAKGMFKSPDGGQPGITSLCVLAYLGRGHLPGQGPYGGQINRGIDFVLSCQKPNGLFTWKVPGRTHQSKQPSHGATYNHAISGLMLCEAYGMTGGKRAALIRGAVHEALAFTLSHQRITKRRAQDHGGWRYLRRRNDNTDSDLSITSWQLMFLRSAKNAGFEVPSKAIDDGVAYVIRCARRRDGTFRYGLGSPNEASITYAMTAAGILSLSMAGRHDTPLAHSAGNWLLRQPLHVYRPTYTVWTRYNPYHYGMFYCSQAMYQLGGRHWSAFYPRMVQTMLRHQRSDGSWDVENGSFSYFGKSYTTALATLALSVPYQMLPIFQR